MKHNYVDDHDFRYVVKTIHQLSESDRREFALCLLNLLLPFELDLQVIAEESAENAKSLSARFTHFVVFLRDALL